MTEAARRKVSAVAIVVSKSSARRRFQLILAKKRSTSRLSAALYRSAESAKKAG